jgi:hypothetical protein
MVVGKRPCVGPEPVVKGDKAVPRTIQIRVVAQEAHGRVVSETKVAEIRNVPEEADADSVIEHMTDLIAGHVVPLVEIGVEDIPGVEVREETRN